MRQTFHMHQKMRKKMTHLVILMSSWGTMGQIWFIMKNLPKKKITGVENAWVEAKSKKYPYLHVSNFNKVNTISDFETETPTHTSVTHTISKIEPKSQNQIPGELNQKFGIPRISILNKF